MLLSIKVNYPLSIFLSHSAKIALILAIASSAACGDQTLSTVTLVRALPQMFSANTWL